MTERIDFLASYTGLVNYARGSNAVSAEAQIVGQAAVGVGSEIEGSEALFGPKARALEELAAVAAECAVPDWDGYGAKPVDPWAVVSAEMIIRGLPDGIPVPEVGAEPDGAISLDWIHSRHRMLSLSVSGDSRLAYGWIDGSESGHAVVGFDGVRLPDRLLSEIGRIMSDAGASVRAA